jgi:hypothetical protein
MPSTVKERRRVRAGIAAVDAAILMSGVAAALGQC